MSGPLNGPSKLGFPQAPSQAPYTPVNHYAPPNVGGPSNSSAFSTIGNGPQYTQHPPVPSIPSTVQPQPTIPGITQPLSKMNLGGAPPPPNAFPTFPASFAPSNPPSAFQQPQSTVSQVPYLPRPSPFPAGVAPPPQPSPAGSVTSFPPSLPNGGPPKPLNGFSPAPPSLPPALHSSTPQFGHPQPPQMTYPQPGPHPSVVPSNGIPPSISGPPSSMIVPPLAGPPQPMVGPPTSLAGPLPPQPMTGPPSSLPGPLPPQPIGIPSSTGPPRPSYPQPSSSSYPNGPTQGGYPVQSGHYPNQGGHPQPGGGGYPQPIGGYPNAGSLTDHIDLAVEKSPMGGGMDEISYTLPSNGTNDMSSRCAPSIFRCTLNAVPQTEELLSKSRLPFGITLHPFRDIKQLNVIRANTIVRCRYCRTYINPFVFLPDARRWKCNLCNKANDLPEDFCYDSSTRSYTEALRRPEMQHATVEFIAPSEYMLRPPQPAVYMFILDVSDAAIRSGYLNTLCEQFLIVLDQMPGDDRTLMSFIAVDSSLHFFQFHTPDKLPRELIIDDIEETFLPSNTGLLVKVKHYKESIRQFLHRLPEIFSHSSPSSSSNCLGSALTVAKEMICELGGRISIFQCSLPTLGPGSLKSREDPNKRAGGEVDVSPATDFYKRLALDCTAVQIGMDLFALSGQYIDLATLSEVVKFSSGTVHRFPDYHDVENLVERKRFEKVVTRYLTRKIGFEAVLRIRCSRGIGISSFFGNFFVRSTDLLSLANVNPDSAVGVQLNIEERIGSSTVCFQAALLYTSSKGDRRIRVHTLCLPTTNELSTLFANVDIKATVSLLAKMGVERACQGAALPDCREALVNASVDGLGAFSKTAGRTGVLSPRGGQLKYLPLLSLALLKHNAFAAGRSIKLDDRVMAMCNLRSAPTEFIFTDLYPLLYRLNEVPQMEETTELRPLPLSFEYISRDGVFLMISGPLVLIYVAASSDPSFVQQLFGVNYHQLDPTSFREQSNDVSSKVHTFINSLIQQHQIRNVPLVIREDSPLRDLFVYRFIEDRSESSHSYVEFINHIRKEIGH